MTTKHSLCVMSLVCSKECSVRVFLQPQTLPVGNGFFVYRDSVSQCEQSPLHLKPTLYWGFVKGAISLVFICPLDTVKII